MRKNKRVELTREQTSKLVSVALEERNPFDKIKQEFGLSETEVHEIMKTRLNADKYDLWKKKVSAAKPKPKPPKIDDFDEDLDGKYYIKNKF